jgi:zinc transport system substrate-binding protein
MDRILESLKTPGGVKPKGRLKVLRLMDMVEDIDEHEDGHGHDHDNLVYDEHVWTSPRNAKSIVLTIAEALCELDAANAELYRRNAADYAAQLDELDAAFRLIVDGAKRNTIIFGDRFPFRHFAEAYGLEYFAAFPSCSAEAEPSAAAVAFLINKVKDENIPVVFHIESSNEKIADIICEATGAKKLLLHSCQTISRKDFESSVSYLDLQTMNAEHLREALW